MGTICFHEYYDIERCYHTKSIQIPDQGPPANIMIDDDNHGSIDVNPSIATMANGHTYNFHFLMTWTHLTIGPGRS